MTVSVNGRPRFELTERGIHIWTLPTRAPGAQLRELEGCLSSDEVARADRFRFTHLRESFVAAHGALRHLLGHYLGVEPGSLQLVSGPQGKPALERGQLHFNLSHSGNLAAVAFAQGCEVGLDLEQIRRLTDLEPIARRFFCSEEAAEVLARPDAERELAFFHCWTRKEAFIKAVGGGLSIPLDSFRVAVPPARPVRVLHVAHDVEAARSWSLHDLSLAPGYAAALAYRDRPRPLHLFPLGDLRELIGPA